MKDRVGRVNRLVQQVLAELVPSALKDPRIAQLALIAVSEVRVTRDLRQARVFLSMVGEERDKQAALDAMARASGFLRGELGRRVQLRNVPELTFVRDTSQDRAAHIDQVLEEIAREGGSGGADGSDGP